MWARSRIDISWSDLAFAARNCVFPGDPEQLTREIEALWSARGDSLVCSSVPDGFDLLLGVWGLPAGSEILFSALNTSAMFDVARRRGLVPVPIDLDAGSLAPDPRAFERAVTPASSAIVVGSLFGMRPDLDPILDAARRRNLRVVEDAAGAFAGREFDGDDRADVTLVSTGRSALGTSLGGALLRIRDPEIREAMRQTDAAHPIESRGDYLVQVCSAAVTKALETRAVYGAMGRSPGIRRPRVEDPNRAAAERAGRRCSAPLLALMRRRLTRWQPAGQTARRTAARTLVDALGGSVHTPGSGSAVHSFREFPIVVDEPDEMVTALRAARFDATRADFFSVLDPPRDRPLVEPKVARDLLERLVLLPCDPVMPRSELMRQAAAVRWAASSESG